MNSSRHGFRPVFSTPFFEIEENPDPGLPNGLPYYRMTGKDAAICCVMKNDGSIALVRQFRPNLGFHTLEFPAGEVEKEELPLDTASREIVEETGLKCKLLELGAFNLMMNRTNIQEHLFFGMDTEPVPDHVPEEGIEMIEVPRTDIISMINNGSYIQLAGLGILQLISISLCVDVLRESAERIHEQFMAKFLDTRDCVQTLP